MKISKWILGMAFLFISLSSLIACSVNKDIQEKRTFPDNGTYIYEPSKKELKTLLEKQGTSSEVLQSLDEYYNYKIDLTIKGNQGTVQFSIEVLGQVKNEQLTIAVDQDQRIIHTVEGPSLYYQIKNNQLTFTHFSEKISDESSLALLKNIVFKRSS